MRTHKRSKEGKENKVYQKKMQWIMNLLNIYIWKVSSWDKYQYAGLLIGLYMLCLKKKKKKKKKLRRTMSSSPTRPAHSSLSPSNREEQEHQNHISTSSITEDSESLIHTPPPPPSRQPRSRLSLLGCF